MMQNNTLSSLPNFIISGAPRSGTTWLAQYLCSQPGIYFHQPLLPEPKIFNSPEKRSETQLIEAYRELYADAPKDSIKGEKTSGYLEDSRCAPVIRKLIPNARLIFILRHPAERAYSNYLFTKKNGYETDSFSKVWHLSSDDRPNPLESSMPHLRLYDYFSRSEYARQLRTYRQNFESRELLIITYEALTKRPGEVLKKISDFIDHPISLPNSTAKEAVNSARAAGCPALSPETRQAFMNRLKSDLEELYSFLPEARSDWEE